MGTSVIVDGKKKRIVMNTAPPDTAGKSYSTSGGKKRKTYRDTASQNIVMVEEKIKDAFKTAPVKLRFQIVAEDKGLSIKYSFIKPAVLFIPYKDSIKNNILDMISLSQTALGMLYKDCMAQLADKNLVRELVKTEKIDMLISITKKVNSAFEQNGKRGLVFKDNVLMAEFYGETFPIKAGIKDWIDMRDYITVESVEPELKVRYHFENDDDRDTYALGELKKALNKVNLYSKKLPPEIPEMYDLKEKINGMHNILLDGKKNGDILRLPKTYYRPFEPDKIYVKTSAGTYSSNGDWNKPEFNMSYSEDIRKITSTEYRELSKRLAEEAKKQGYVRFMYCGGEGLLNEGVTKINIGREGTKITRVEITMGNGGLPKENISVFFHRIKKAYEKQIEADKQASQELFAERLKDTEIHENGLKLFRKKHKKIYAGEVTQMMFLFLEKNDGNVERKVFDQFVCEKCYADDMISVMLYVMAKAEVIRFDEEKVYFAPKAKYMRVLTYETLGIDENGIDDAIEKLSEIAKTCRKERNEKKSCIK